MRFPSNHLNNILRKVYIIIWKPHMIIVRNPCGSCCANANYPRKKRNNTTSFISPILIQALCSIRSSKPLLAYHCNYYFIHLSCYFYFELISNILILRLYGVPRKNSYGIISFPSRLRTFYKSIDTFPNPFVYLIINRVVRIFE